MKNQITYFFLGIVVTILFFCFGSLDGCLKNQEHYPTTMDTIYVNKPYKEVVIKEVEIIKPTTVYVYETDTIFRQQLEKDTLISGVEITAKTAKIHTITPKGLHLLKSILYYPTNAFLWIMRVIYPSNKRSILNAENSLND